MKITAKTLAIAMVAALSSGIVVPPSASAYCGHGYVSHRAYRTYVSRRTYINRVSYAPVVERTIMQPAVVEEAAPMVAEPVYSAMPICHRRHHLLGIDTPLFGFHLF